MKDAKEVGLCSKTIEAICGCHYADGTKEAAENATRAFAGCCGITCERARAIAVEIS